MFTSMFLSGCKVVARVFCMLLTKSFDCLGVLSVLSAFSTRGIVSVVKVTRLLLRC